MAALSRPEFMVDFRVVGWPGMVYDRTQEDLRPVPGEWMMLDLDRIEDQIPPGTRKAVQYLYQLEDQEKPVTITINGKVSIAVSDDGSFRMLVQLVD